MADGDFMNDDEYFPNRDDNRVSRATRQAERARARAATEQRSNANLVVMGVALALMLGVFGMLVFGPVLMGGGGGGASTGSVPLASAPASTPAPAFVEATSTEEPTQAATAEQPAEEQKTIGKSVEDRDIVAHRFGTGDRKVLVLGGVHGDEWSAGAVDEFVGRLKSDTSLVPEGAEIHVIPVLNPDGREDDTRGNANRVDLNRNMPSKNWQSELEQGDSSAKKGLSGGDSAGSEPETKALLKYLADNKFDVVVSVHSQGGIIDWDGPGDDLAKRISKITGLPRKHLGYQEYIHGSMGLYIPEKYDIPVITIEMAREGLSDKLLEGILEAAKE